MARPSQAPALLGAAAGGTAAGARRPQIEQEENGGVRGVQLQLGVPLVRPQASLRHARRAGGGDEMGIPLSYFGRSRRAHETGAMRVSVLFASFFFTWQTSRTCFPFDGAESVTSSQGHSLITFIKKIQVNRLKALELPKVAPAPARFHKQMSMDSPPPHVAPPPYSP